MTSPSPGPRPAVRSADEAAREIWDGIVDYADLEQESDWLHGMRHGLICALFYLTGEDHESIRARAVDQGRFGMRLALARRMPYNFTRQPGDANSSDPPTNLNRGSKCVNV